MKKNLESRLRLRVRRIVESALEEEPMPPPASDFKRKPIKKPGVAIRVGGARVSYRRDGKIAIADESGNQAHLSEEDAIKVANYIIRLSGKV